MKKLFILSMILLTAASAFAGGTKEESTEKVLKIGVPDNARFLDTVANSDNASMRVMGNIHETFIEIDEDGTIIPRLAESWKQIDAKTIEFKLREDVVSHAGHPLDADDVLVSFGEGRCKVPEDPGYDAFKQYTGLFKSIEKIDNYTVRFTKAEDDPLLLLRFTFNTSAVICGDSYKAKKSWEEWMVHPVGFGPYYVDEYKPDEYMTFRKFDNYYGEKAPVDVINYTVIPEMAPRIMGLLSGDYDLVTEVMPDQFSTIENKKNYEVTGGPINNVRVITYDTVANPVLADPRIRLALNYAIDRELINNTIFKGISEIPAGIQMKNFGKMYIKEFEPVGFDPEKAKQLLKEAGYKGEEIGYRYLVDTTQVRLLQLRFSSRCGQMSGLTLNLNLRKTGIRLKQMKLLKAEVL